MLANGKMDENVIAKIATMCKINEHEWKIVGYHPAKSSKAVCSVEFECVRCGKRKIVDSPTGIATH